MKKLAIIISSIFLAINVFSAEDINLETANKFYAENNFTSALEYYQLYIDSSYVSVELFYNIGNTHYQLSNLADAIYYYEKALKLSPNDKDIKFNLNLANSKITDQVESIPTIFYNKWFRYVRDSFNSTAWALICLISLALSLIFLSVMLIAKTSKNKNIYKFLSVFLALIFISSFYLGYSQKQYQTSTNQAIVFNASMVKSSPNQNGNNLFEIHEGLKIQIVETLDSWSNIKLSDGKQGWVLNENIKKY